MKKDKAIIINRMIKCYLAVMNISSKQLKE